MEEPSVGSISRPQLPPGLGARTESGSTTLTAEMENTIKGDGIGDAGGGSGILGSPAAGSSLAEKVEAGTSPGPGVGRRSVYYLLYGRSCAINGGNPDLRTYGGGGLGGILLKEVFTFCLVIEVYSLYRKWPPAPRLVCFFNL